MSATRQVFYNSYISMYSMSVLMPQWETLHIETWNKTGLIANSDILFKLHQAILASNITGIQKTPLHLSSHPH